jgi:hypothetical protein
MLDVVDRYPRDALQAKRERVRLGDGRFERLAPFDRKNRQARPNVLRQRSTRYFAVQIRRFVRKSKNGAAFQIFKPISHFRFLFGNLTFAAFVRRRFRRLLFTLRKVI